MSGRLELRLSLDQTAQDVIERLRVETQAETRAAVLRDALGVYNALHEMLRDNPGQRLVLLNRASGSMRELAIPRLQQQPEAP